MKGLGNLSKDFAKRNVAIELRGGQTGRKQGLDVENALKHDIVGTPREMATIGQSKLNDLNAKAKAIGANSDEAVNVPSLLDAVKGNFSRQKNVHDYDDIISFIDDLDAKYRKAYPSADITLPQAMELRTQIGKKASFVGGRFDPDADWKEQVYNGLYDEIKDQIHAKGGPELQAINRAQSEIIPVVNAAKRRMPIAESNNRVSLADLLTTGVGAHVSGAGLGAATGAALPGDRLKNSLEGAALGAGLAGVRRLAGSPAVTKALYGLGSKLSPTLERPLNELNPADYPTGKQWPEVPPKNPPNDDFNYGPAARHTPPPDSPPANMELPATVDQYDDQQKFLKSLKSELWQKIPDKTDRDLLLGNVTRDKKGNLLHLSVQAENALQDAVDAIRENPEWHSDIPNIGFEVPEHIDDVKSWLSSIGNEPAAGKPRLPLAGLGDDSFLGRTLGNERGAVGATIRDFTNPQTGEINFKYGDVRLREIPSENGIEKEASIYNPKGDYWEQVSMQDSRIRAAQKALGDLKYGQSGSGAIPLMAAGAGLGGLGLGGYGALKSLSDKYRSFRSGNNQQGGSP
jgi:hypothetical protein